VKTPGLDSDISQKPNIYIILPHSAQTIATLHAHLASILSDSQLAIDLLRSIQLLQYFDLVGLVESVAEVSDKIYRASQQVAKTSTPIKDIVLLQGITETVMTTQRRNGLVQANSLLSSLMRNVTQLSRMSTGSFVLVDVELDVSDASEKRGALPLRGMVLDSAFSGSNGESLRLVAGHETVARTMEGGLDCVVAVHNGAGRASKKAGKIDRIVEIVKDSCGDLLGLWDVWKGA
jgi:hypothetical protein